MRRRQGRSFLCGIFLAGLMLGGGLAGAARAECTTCSAQPAPVNASASPPVSTVLPIAPPSVAMEERPVAVLRALDKITARVEELEVPIGRPVLFGTLTLTAHTCRVAPPEEKPESVAFLEITETKPGAASPVLFQGWMFASSLSLSALEHPVYDVWVIGCKSDSTR